MAEISVREREEQLTSCDMASAVAKAQLDGANAFGGLSESKSFAVGNAITEEPWDLSFQDVAPVRFVSDESFDLQLVGDSMAVDGVQLFEARCSFNYKFTLLRAHVFVHTYMNMWACVVFDKKSNPLLLVYCKDVPSL